MPVDGDVLRELHRIHQQVTDLRSRLERGPRQIRIGEGAVAKAEADLKSAKETLQKAKVAADERQLQLRQREARIEDHRIKLNAANSNKEFQALKDQIAADQQANSVLSDEILEMLEKIDGLEAKVAAATAAVSKAQADVLAIKERVAAEHDGLESELGRVSAELAAAEEKLPPDFKVDYLRVVKSRGEDALAEVEGECCGACNQTLTPQNMAELHLGKPLFCKSCGSLLYLPEDSSPT